MTPLAVLEFFTLGLVLGWLGGLFGIGGGLIAISILGLAFGLDQQHAQGTSLVMVVPTALIGVYQYWRRGGMDWRIVTTMAVAACLSTYLFARLAVALPSTPLRRSFVIFLLALAAYNAWRAYADARSSTKPFVLPWPWTGVIGLLGGAISGLFTVGGAVFSVPALTLAFGVSQTVAQGMGLAVVIPGLLIGLAVYGAAGDIHWSTGLALAAGGISTVSLGVAQAHRLPESALRLCFSALLAVTAALLWPRA